MTAAAFVRFRLLSRFIPLFLLLTEFQRVETTFAQPPQKKFPEISCKQLLSDAARAMGTPQFETAIQSMHDRSANEIYEVAGKRAALFMGSQFDRWDVSVEALAEGAAALVSERDRKMVRDAYPELLHAATQAHLDELYLGRYQTEEYLNQFRGKAPVTEFVAVFTPESITQELKIREFLRRPQFTKLPRLLTGPSSPQLLAEMTKVRTYWFRPIPLALKANEARSLKIHVLGESEYALANFLEFEILPLVLRRIFQRVEVIIYPNFAWSQIRGRAGVLDLSLYRRPRPVPAYARGEDAISDRTIYVSFPAMTEELSFTIDHTDIDD